MAVMIIVVGFAMAMDMLLEHAAFAPLERFDAGGLGECHDLDGLRKRARNFDCKGFDRLGDAEEDRRIIEGLRIGGLQ